MQKLVTEFIKKYNLQANEQIRYIDLVSEIGELGKEIIKSNNYGKKDFETNAEQIVEMGDCLFSLLALCHEMNINAQEVLIKAIYKYESRFAQKGDIGSNT